MGVNPRQTRREQAKERMSAAVLNRTRVPRRNETSTCRFYLSNLSSIACQSTDFPVNGLKILTCFPMKLFGEFLALHQSLHLVSYRDVLDTAARVVSRIGPNQCLKLLCFGNEIPFQMIDQLTSQPLRLFAEVREGDIFQVAHQQSI